MILPYLVGLGGMWVFFDGLVSIRLYYSSVDETGKRRQSWRYDHSIRLIRCAWGVLYMVAGVVLR